MGYYRDAADRLYVRARYYRPDLGLWLSADPVATEPPYLYVHNAPATLVDPAGTQGLLFQSAPSSSGGLVSGNITHPDEIPLIGMGGGMLSFLGASGARGGSLLSAPDLGIPPGHPAGLAYPGMFTAPSVQYVHTNDEGFLTAPTPPAPNFPSVSLPTPRLVGQALEAGLLRLGQIEEEIYPHLCAIPVSNLVGQAARFGLVPNATDLVLPALGPLAKTIIPQALAAWGDAREQTLGAALAPSSSAQLMAEFERMDADFGRGLVEGFLTEGCETFNPAVWATILLDLVQCMLLVQARIWQNPLAIGSIVAQAAWSPLAQAWQALTHMKAPSDAHAWGKLTGAVLFHVVIALVLFFTTGPGVAAEGAVAAGRTVIFVSRARKALQGAELLRTFSAAHDPQNPCASSVVGAVTLGAAYLGVRGLEKGLEKLEKVLQVRLAELQAKIEKERAQPAEPSVTETAPLPEFRIAAAGEFVDIGQGDAIQHFTDLAGASGITGVPEDVLQGLRSGERAVVGMAHFLPGENTFLTGEGGNVGVTKLGPEASAGKLERIGVFGERQNYVIEFSRETLFENEVPIRPDFPERSIFSIPGNSIVRGVITVQRVR